MSTNIKSFAALLALVVSVVDGSAQGTAFTYQGQLDYGGNPATGAFDLTFTLYTTPTGGSQALPSLTNLDLAVNGGQFSTALDFGPGVFNGPTYWLEVGARTNGGTTFNTLAPRQEISPTPYAIYATSAGAAMSADTAAMATGFSGLLSGDVTGLQGATIVSTIGGQPASAIAGGALAANGASSANTAGAIVARDDAGSFAAGVVTATEFAGDGSGLTNLQASSLTGTVGNLLLTNVAFVSASNNLTGVLVATNPANQLSGTLSGNATTASTANTFSGSLSGDVTGTQGATVVSIIAGQRAAAIASGVAAANGATSANSVGTLVQRDGTGSFSASTITASNFIGNGAGLTNIPISSLTGIVGNTLLTNVALLSASNNLTNVLIATNPANQLSGSFIGNLTGNATTAGSSTSAGTATTFSGTLVGDVTGTQGNTIVSSVGGQTALFIANGAIAANGAATANTSGAIVARDISGNFSAGTITASGFSGNGSGLTNYQGANLADYAGLNLLTLSGGTNVSLPFQQEGAIYQVVTTNLCFSNITGLQPGYNKMTLYLQATNTFAVSWLPNVNLVGSFTTNGLQLTNSQGWWVMALTVLGTNWQTNTCTYAISPPNQ